MILCQKIVVALKVEGGLLLPTHGVPQGSILGPILFLVMVADLPGFVTNDTSNGKTMSYADDSSLYASSKDLSALKADLERMSEQMISYRRKAGLILNSDKTQLLVSTKEKFTVKVGSSLIEAKPEITLLGVDYDSSFTTRPYLQNLAQDAKTRSDLNYTKNTLANFT